MKQVAKGLLAGNVYKESQIQKPRKKGGQDGWIFGWFAKEPFYTEEFEVKLGDHKKGKRKKKIAFNEKSKTFVVLINGKMLINFYKKNKKLFKKVTLEKAGDFIFYDSKIGHDWVAVKHCRTLTIRWPSIKNDQKSF